MKTVLVTGGAGFIGSHLCARLLDKGYDVLCVDNFFSGRKENLDEMVGNPRFELIRHDVETPLSLEVDQIYNLACPASPIFYQKIPAKTVKTCVLGAVNMLELAKKTGARILQASTSEVYGDPKVHPQPEAYVGNVNPLGPRACYDEGKRVAETLFMNYHRQNAVDIRIVRIFNTYGPKMLINDGRVVSNLIVQALQNKPLTIYGNGGQTRSFCYISDMVVGLIGMMEQECEIGPINLGNPTETTVGNLAKFILEMTQSRSPIVTQPLPEDDPKIRCPDITKAKAILGWLPKVPLEEGLQKTIDYFRHTLI